MALGTHIPRILYYLERTIPDSSSPWPLAAIQGCSQKELDGELDSQRLWSPVSRIELWGIWGSNDN